MTCGRKLHSFTSRRQANQWIRDNAGITAHNGGPLLIRQAYACAACGAWHVTSTIRPERKPRK